MSRTAGPAGSTSSTATTRTTGDPSNTSSPRTTTTTRPKPSTTTTAPPTTTTGANGVTYTIFPPASASTPLPKPAALTPFASSPLPGEGVWQPAGRLVGGRPAVYVTTIEEPGSNQVAGVAWMDPHLLAATLYSGSLSPGGGPWAYTAPVVPSQASSLVAAFNGGFQISSSNGGYYDYGQTVAPLRNGAASFVIFTNGSATVADWGRDVSMGPDIAAVRQNLTLLVDNGQPVAGLNPYDTSVWGSTLGGIPDVWRSGVGVTSDGGLVYVAGPALEVPQLAQLLQRAGAIRAMEMDINPAWPTYATFSPVPASAPASAANATNLVAGMAGTGARFFETWWDRDFIAMTARPLIATGAG